MPKVVIYYSWQCSRVDGKNVPLDYMPDLKVAVVCVYVVIADSR